VAKENIRVSAIIPAEPERIYRAWLDADEHSRFTGGRATVEPGVGGRHSAWDGYIEGRTIALEPGRRIVQSWRSSEFSDSDDDSTIELLLEPHAEGTLLTIAHSDIPDGQASGYEAGWHDYYFTPMERYFAQVARQALEDGPAKIEPAKKASAKRAKKASVKPTKKSSAKRAKKAPAKPTKKASAKRARRAPPKKRVAKRTSKRRR
jgi:uncharacterized protein YndB with AHSA1/START domain